MSFLKKLATPILALNVAVFRATGGKRMATIRGMPVLLLTCTGRKTGKQRTVPIVYIRDGDDYVVMASMAGAPTHPVWFLNLSADPKVIVEVDGRTFDARATITSGEERARLWKEVVARGPFFENEYQAKTTREIPVVRLTPTAS